jgi:hypothetical protein
LERLLDPPDLRAANDRRHAARIELDEGKRASLAEMVVRGALWLTGGLALLVLYDWAAAEPLPGVPVDRAARDQNLLIALAGLLGPGAAAWLALRGSRDPRRVGLVALAMLVAYAAILYLDVLPIAFLRSVHR